MTAGPWFIEARENAAWLRYRATVALRRSAQAHVENEKLAWTRLSETLFDAAEKIEPNTAS